MFSPKNMAIRHKGPWHYAEFQKKNKEKSESQVNFRTEAKKDGQTFIHKTLPTTAGVQ